MRLSKHFTLDEMIASQYATRHGINNLPNVDVIANLERLCLDYLEPLRAIVNAPIVVSSGYRSPALNKAIGGSMSSAHMVGLAVDLSVPGMSVYDVCKRAALVIPHFDQIIDEFGSWVHLSITNKTIKPRRQHLQARRDKNGSVTYSAASFV
jgi:zinc D-Ala-D-Ala carboxypeptidase